MREIKKKITDKHRLDFLSGNNMLSDFRKSIDTVINFSENPNFDDENLELLKKKVSVSPQDTSNNVFIIEIDYKSEYINETDYGYIFYLPTDDNWVENSFVYVPTVGLEKHGNEPMWCSFLQLLLDDDVQKIRIYEVVKKTEKTKREC